MRHTYTVTRTRELRGCPKWMQFALEGKKISAIKALRETANNSRPYDDRDGHMGLLEAKRIVEEFLVFIIETETQE